MVMCGKIILEMFINIVVMIMISTRDNQPTQMHEKHKISLHTKVLICVMSPIFFFTTVPNLLNCGWLIVGTYV